MHTDAYTIIRNDKKYEKKISVTGAALYALIINQALLPLTIYWYHICQKGQRLFFDREEQIGCWVT